MILFPSAVGSLFFLWARSFLAESNSDCSSVMQQVLMHYIKILLPLLTPVESAYSRHSLGLTWCRCWF